MYIAHKNVFEGNALVNPHSQYIYFFLTEWIGNIGRWLQQQKIREVAELFLKSFHCPSYIWTPDRRIHWLTTKWLLLFSFVIYFVYLLFVYYTPHGKKKAKTIFSREYLWKSTHYIVESFCAIVPGHCECNETCMVIVCVRVCCTSTTSMPCNAIEQRALRKNICAHFASINSKLSSKHAATNVLPYHYRNGEIWFHWICWKNS